MFVIGLFKVEETDIEEVKGYVNRTITFKGNFDSLNKGEKYIFNGNCVNHPKYGFQFDVSSYEVIKPEGKDGVIAYLSSGIFGGIGKNTARIIVNTLGEDAKVTILATGMEEDKEKWEQINVTQKDDAYYEELIPQLYKPVPNTIGDMIGQNQEPSFEVEPAPEPEPAVVPEPEPQPEEPAPTPKEPTLLERLKRWLDSFVDGEN